jgi:hypothetical protein
MSARSEEVSDLDWFFADEFSLDISFISQDIEFLGQACGVQVVEFFFESIKSLFSQV